MKKYSVILVSPFPPPYGGIASYSENLYNGLLDKNIDTIVPDYEIVFSNDPMTEHLYSKRNVDVITIPFLKRDQLSGTRLRELIKSDHKWDDLVPEGTKILLENLDAKNRLKIL